MAKQFPQIDDQMRAFIEAQHFYFVGSAAPEGRVNLSPKGMDSLRVLGPNRIALLNWTGSGNETAGHLLQANRITLMWCSFTKRPMILRAYGTARTLHPRDADWDQMLSHFPPSPGARQIFDVSVDMMQTSCGYAVPYFDYAGERDTLAHWARDRGPDGIETYWDERNRETIDGQPTGILDDPE